jgi:uridine phosphorylase
MYLITPADVEKQALAQGVDATTLQVARLAFLTFNQSVLEELAQLADTQEWEWPAAQFTPAFSPLFKGWRGRLENEEIAVFVPHMGSSTLASFCEELIHYGAKVIFLLCASWGLGESYLGEGQIHLPSCAVGIDGTSPHYGNSEGRVEAEPRAFQALSAALDQAGAVWKEGGVGSCEAFYRITPQLADEYREQGCLSMENGETAALFALARAHDIPIGVLLQPYIDLEQGWSLSYMGEKYKEAGKMQVHAAVEASRSLLPNED